MNIALAAFLFAQPQTVDPAKLQALVEQAKKRDSNALIVYVDGKKVVDETFGHPVEPIEAMSCTKSIVSLAAGLLLEEGKLPSLDATVHDFFPSYTGGGKEKVTVRHLLTQTSGIRVYVEEESPNMSKDFLKDAMEAPLVSPPGTQFVYNNRGTNLLALVLAKAAGQRLDLYLQDRLFGPMDIKIGRWLLDDAGNAEGMAGCKILPSDFAKIGLMLANDGVWEGRQIIPKGWIEESTKVNAFSEKEGATYGCLWWPVGSGRALSMTNSALIGWWSQGGDSFSKELRHKLEPLTDHPYATEADFLAAVQKVIGKGRDFRTVYKQAHPLGKEWNEWIDTAPYVGYSAQGYLGNYLVVLPKEHVVAVRMNTYGHKIDSWTEFPLDVAALVKR